MKNITVQLNGTPLTEATGFTYDEMTGVFLIAPGVLTVPAALYARDTVTNRRSITPGTAVLTVTVMIKNLPI